MQEVWTNAFSNVYSGFNFMLPLYAFLAAVALLVVMRLTGLLRRDTLGRRLFVCLYYLYIPVVFIICGAAWSSISSVESSVLGAIKDARPAISSASAEYASSAWKTVASTFQKDPSISIKDMCLAVASDYANKLMDGFVPTRASMFVQPFVQPVVDSLKDGVASSVAQAVEDMALKKVSDATSVDKDRLRTFLTADFTSALQEGLITDIITHQAKNAISSLYSNVKLMFALLMLPVILETAFALYRRRKTAA
jgi:hypothetical protein